ncbi:MAG: MAPEG family protein [Natronospirillum sp.]|uniref:MAPEG family protein n=1 Tax=Natronospirillum sp. TaxID=2812955 RepID=UPI0025F8BA9B|nr:MAPEG family protein [Natronospirillum sp.]MCH8552294.1 MAPEG family protein [Natronospirillum sp.]
MAPERKPHFLDSPDQIDMGRAEKSIRTGGTVSLLIVLGAGSLGYWLLPGVIRFPEALAERLAFAAQVSSIILFCLLVAVGMVSTGRRFSAEDIGGAAAGPPSERLAIKSAFLQNTLEQAVLAVGFYLAFAALVSGPWLSVLPVSAACFVVGRVLFYRGYVRGVEGRAFGMTLTMMPVILGYPAVFVLMILNALG